MFNKIINKILTLTHTHDTMLFCKLVPETNSNNYKPAGRWDQVVLVELLLLGRCQVELTLQVNVGTECPTPGIYCNYRVYNKNQILNNEEGQQ